MKTLGEKRVRIDFNSEDSGLVSSIKKEAAKDIDFLEAIKKVELEKKFVPGEEVLAQKSKEKIRLITIAQMTYEEAALWAVKAVTG